MSENRQPPRPQVTLLCLDKEPWFDETFQSLLIASRARVTVTEIDTTTAASALFTANRRHPAVLVTDGTITTEEHSQLRLEAVRFVLSGGSMIFGFVFTSPAQLDDINDLFKAFSLPWKSGPYSRRDFAVNAATRLLNPYGLVHRYSQKALQLQNVEKNDAIYLPMANSRVRAFAFVEDDDGEPILTPAVLAGCGNGRVGYLVDVNAEDETTKIVLAMCGVLS